MVHPPMILHLWVSSDYDVHFIGVGHRYNYVEDRDSHHRLCLNGSMLPWLLLAEPGL